MSSVFSFIAAHPTTSALVGYYFASAAIGSMPAPGPNASMFYQWLYRFANTLAGNLFRAFATKLPAQVQETKGPNA